MPDSQPSRPTNVRERASTVAGKEALADFPARSRAIFSPAVLSAGCILLFAVSSAYIFRGAWNPFNTLDGADLAIFFPSFVRKWTHALFVPRWFPHYLAGIPQQFQFLSHSLPLMLAIPPHRLYAFQFMLDTFLAGAFMFAFLRDQHIGRFGALVGGLAFQLSNGFITSASQGFAWKFDTVCWVPLFLLFFSRLLDDSRRKLTDALFAGAVLGIMFLGGEIQLAYYVCLFAFAFFAARSILSIFGEQENTGLIGGLKSAGRRSFLAALVVMISIAFAAEIFHGYLTYSKNNENVGVASEADNWRFATEFSFAPKETLSLVFGGDIFGDVYAAREYEGRQVVRESDDYLGIAVLMFAFVGLFSDRKNRVFFAVAAGAALLISFGKYFPPPYRLVYMLPIMKGFRNPHKWLFITSLCVSILAGMGADYWMSAPASKNRKLVALVTAFAGLICLLLLVGVAVNRNRNEMHLAAFVRPLVILGVSALACLLIRIKEISRYPFARVALAAVILAALAGDLAVNAQPFISYYDPRAHYIEDKLVQWMNSQPGPFRVKLWSESHYLKNVVTKVLPYHEIDAVDVIMSRRPKRYTDVFQALRDRRLSLERFFEVMNVKYILSPAPIPPTAVPLRPAGFFGSGASTESRTCYAYEFENFLPRAYAVERYEVREENNVIDALNAADFDARETVVLEKQPTLPSEPAADVFSWSVDELSRSPHRVELRAQLSKPAIVVMNDFFDERWRAQVDGQQAEILRANYLMRAVVVPEGTHTVTFAYAPRSWPFALTLAGWCGVILLAAWVGVTGVTKTKRAYPDAAG
ncbi:MAG: hypothetical protein C4520_03410 [Candidatus Abyssobacteria bacterium SURF_5]|uniref:YfhO family protein n=1 Tax=Abyssobacteria bacterium (strain SURF_5) TaxID=2093360 RepID=A0A3A4P5V5_ABYX5|nr:MAG: hypothetical protein C4520_03410 [Candidatus Abyssubacteria bacterium SURF_5]